LSSTDPVIRLGISHELIVNFHYAAEKVHNIIPILQRGNLRLGETSDGIKMFQLLSSLLSKMKKRVLHFQVG